ncbi:MAG: hypothetical protein FWG94_09935 [Oscillospiraceae bacterium]|nr:hypothetical protein [Oscillospiraceae bacterium]
MAMSELKQNLLKYELTRAGFPDAQYIPAKDCVAVAPGNKCMPEINDDGGVQFWPEYRYLAMNTIAPIASMVSEIVESWEKSTALTLEGVPEFRKLAEYNKIVLAARDDSEYGRGLHFVTWEYNYEHTGFNHGHYFTDYAAAKEDFAVRAGLMPQAKVFTKEQATEIRRAVEFSINNNDDLALDAETELKRISARLTAGYGLPAEAAGPSTCLNMLEQNAHIPKQKTLDEKLGAVDRKVKVQDTHNDNKSRDNREER